MPFEFGRELSRYPQDHARCGISVMVAHVCGSNLCPHCSVFQINTALVNPRSLRSYVARSKLQVIVPKSSWETKMVKLLTGCRQVLYLLDRGVLSRGDIKLCEMEICII